MPTILTKGLGYDQPTIIKREFGSEIVGTVIVEERIYGTVTVEESPVAHIIGIVSEDGVLMPSESNMVEMFIRDDRTLSLSVHSDVGSAINITGSKLWMSVKERSTDNDNQALFIKKNTAAGGSDAQIKIISGIDGQAEIYIVPDDTDDNKIKAGTFLYAIQIQLANNKIYTIVRDKFVLKDDIVNGH